MSTDRIETFDDIFRIGVEYMYDAEKQLTQALPKVAEAASAPALRTILDEHLHETQVHVQRLEQVCSQLGITPGQKNNRVMEAMIHEVEGMIRNGQPSPLLDAALIVAANQVEHFEIGSYGSLRTFAELMGESEVVRVLDMTLLEEKRADQKLTQLAESQINRDAAETRARRAA